MSQQQHTSYKLIKIKQEELEKFLENPFSNIQTSNHHINEELENENNEPIQADTKKIKIDEKQNDTKIKKEKHVNVNPIYQFET